MPTPTSHPESKLRQLAERDQRVFASYPLVARYFPGAAVEDARQRLSRATDRGDGPGLIIGAPGTGKSLLLQVLATQYHARFDVVLLACARLCTRRALLQAVLFELGLPYKLRDEGDLRLSLLDHLLSEQCPAGLLLLVDEAQALPTALLDELRILTNLVRGGVPRVWLVLAGSSALEESFAHPELESFSQRLSARCYLAPFNREETWQYIRAQIAACGVTPDDVIAPDAAAAVFDATDGVPRLINQLCDRALQFAVAKGASRLDRQVVQEAWADLQQLPTPWETPPVEVATAADNVIEFGKLGDERIAAHDCDEVRSDVDDTELDADEQAIATRSTVINLPHGAPTIAAVDAATDPFAEKFDEEEVVLDNFASWDDMFRRELPRVENRRDPGFSTLVQAAIEASPVSATRFVVSSTAVDDNLTCESPSNRPRLRLADVPESTPCDHLSAATTSASQTPNSADALGSILSAFASDTSATIEPIDDDPLLIIEEDAPQSSAQPPVRREDYRNLFSRLRSG
ncbi:MAG: AAA family ATPase [Planctomycetes bacterium]|nr:AAA family ATPase [Planctomycetota bacterium]